MFSRVPAVVFRALRAGLAGGVLFLVMAYLVFGPTTAHVAASQFLSRVFNSVQELSASSELDALDDQIADDRTTLATTIARRGELGDQVRNLVGLRNDLIAKRSRVAKRRRPVMLALESSSDRDVVRVVNRLFRRRDVHACVRALYAQETSLEREITGSERAIAQLVSGLDGLDVRIAEARRRLYSKERHLNLKRYQLEGASARNDVLDRLQSLERLRDVR